MPKITKEMQGLFGYTDEQVESLEENQILYIEKMGEMRKYNVVAEVVESRNCAWGAKVGDKIVMRAGGAIDTKECTNKDLLCIWALTPLQPFSHIFMDRIACGIDPTKPIFKRTHCLDNGVEHCGWGQIVMDVRVEPV
ncbi:MAG: hypothetical protein ABIJ37_04705 [Pseudomonadota bacterium]